MFVRVTSTETVYLQHILLNILVLKSFEKTNFLRCHTIKVIKVDKVSDNKGTSSELEKLKESLLKFLEGENVKIVLFGSRARGDCANTSDVDVGIIVRDGVERTKLIELREYIEDLNIPYKVDIVDFSIVSEKFKDMVLKEAVIWKD